MRANVLPTPRELTGPNAVHDQVVRATRAIEVTTRAAEILLDEPIRPLTLHFRILTGVDTVYKLAHFPIRNLKLDGKENDNLDPDLEYGIIRTMMPIAEHDVSYDVGYLPGQVPAVVKALVTSLSRYYLTGSDEEKRESLELIVTGRRMRAEARRERDVCKVDRESPG